MNDQVSEYINNAPQEQKQLMESIRSLIYQTVPDVSEEFKWSRPVYRGLKDFAYMKSNKSYLTLGFYNSFEKLNDPGGLLEGSGTTMRHIKLKNDSDIDTELLTEWFAVLAKD